MLWDWLVWGHPLGEMVLGSLHLTHDERGVIQQALEETVRERAGGRGTAKLANPTNIDVGTMPLAVAEAVNERSG